MKHIRIAIDGPSGAGKSTLARSIAAKLGYVYVDTGAIYRTISCYMLEQGIDPTDEKAVVAALPQAKVVIRYGADGLQHMLLNGADVTERIRRPEVSGCASVVSAYPDVRAHLLEMQRQMASADNVVMDGRDIGTVVLPDAEIKVFLTASAQERARRRTLELEQRGTPQSYETTLREIEERDWNDTHRATAPLRQAADAVMLDTTQLDFQASEEALLRIIQERSGT